MGKRWTWVAWSMLAVFVVSVVLAAILAAANRTLEPVGFAALGLGFGAFMVVGALIVAHRPSNAIGWIFSAPRRLRPGTIAPRTRGADFDTLCERVVPSGQVRSLRGVPSRPSEIGSGGVVEGRQEGGFYMLGVFAGHVSGSYGQPDWTLEDPQVGQRTVTRSVTFPQPFPGVPLVLVNLTGLDGAAGKNLRVRVYAADVTPAGFNVKFETWADSVIYGVRASWIAMYADYFTVRY